MKISRISLVLTLTIVAAIFLSSCAGGVMYNAWPGLSAKDGVVYLAYLNGVFAVKDGSMLWRFPEKADNGKTFFAMPTVGRDVVVVGDYANQVYGVNLQNGLQSWAYNKENGHVVAGSLIVGDTILVPSSDHNLYALNSSGDLLWEYRTDNILWAQPSSDGRIVFLPAMDHNVYALNLADGSLVWKKDLGAALPASGALVEGKAFYVVNLAGKVMALNLSNGDILWEAQLEGQVWSAPLLVGETLYVGSSNNKVYLIDTGSASNRILRAVDLGSPVIGGGVQFGNNVVFATEGGGLFAVDRTGQTTQWNPTVNGKLYTTPVVAGDHLVVAVKDGDALLVAFDQQGSEVWAFVAPK